MKRFILTISFLLFVFSVYAGPIQQMHNKVIAQKRVAESGGGTLVGDDAASATLNTTYSVDRMYSLPFTATATGTGTSICLRPGSIANIKLAVYDPSDNLIDWVEISSTDLSGASQCGTISASITSGLSYRLGWIGEVNFYLYNSLGDAQNYQTRGYELTVLDPITYAGTDFGAEPPRIWVEN